MTTQNDVSFYEEGDLFRRVPSQEYHELMACVGTNGGPYGFDDYAIGYFEAARLIWNSIEGGEATVDVAVYPLTFLYRQGNRTLCQTPHFLLVVSLLVWRASQADAWIE